MKILHIYRTYFPDPPGGLQEAIRQICVSTKTFGIESKVFTLSPNPTPSIIHREEAEVIRAKSWWSPASCDIGGLASIDRYRELSHWADIIHFHFPWPFADLLNFLVHSDKPKIMTYHSDIVRQAFLNTIYSPLMRHHIKSMNTVVATSPAYIATSPVLQSISASRVKMIPLGIIDHSKCLTDASSDKEYIVKLGLNGEPFVLALGVLRYYKGLHFLLNAARSIGCKIVIAGNGPEEQKLRNQAIKLGLDNVVFVGRVTEDEKNILLQYCHALVLSSHLRSEAFGMVLVEAAMYAKPMVCCEVGSGTSYVNQDGVTGFVVPPRCPKGLSLAINKLVNDIHLAREMGKAARQHYEKNFSGEALGKSYADLYRELAVNNC